MFPVAVSEVVVSLSFRPSLSHCLGFYLSISGHSFRFPSPFLVSSASSLFIEIPGHGCVGSGARWSGGRQAPLPRCFSRFRWRGGWSASGFGFGGPKAWSVGPWHVRREAGTKTPVFLFSATPAGGRRREFLFLFLFFLKKKRMKRRRFIQMWRQKRANVHISPPIIFVPFNCVPANFGLVRLVGRLFHFSPWSLIYAI